MLECLLHEAQNVLSRRKRRAFKHLRASKPLRPVDRASWEERAMRAALSARVRRPCAAPSPFITSFYWRAPGDLEAVRAVVVQQFKP